MRKSQSALEFLTTYGWAFLVILIMIGALAYFGVLNPQRFLPDRCNTSPGFVCEEYQLEDDGTGVIILRNRIGSAINIDEDSLVCNDAVPDGIDECNIQAANSDNIGVDELFNISITAINSGANWAQGNKVRVDYQFSYIPVGRTLPQSTNGEVYATVQ
jgi:hypothetical protein